MTVPVTAAFPVTLKLSATVVSDVVCPIVTGAPLTVPSFTPWEVFPADMVIPPASDNNSIEAAPVPWSDCI